VAARELARCGVRVVTLAPGLFETPMMAGLTPEARDSLTRLPPFPARLGKPAEFAAMVRAIAANPMRNGEIIRLDARARSILLDRSRALETIESTALSAHTDSV